jgi:glutamate synthase domain-containing protein 3
VNGIRDRVALRADGGIKTGADAVKLIALGADEVALGSALAIAEQCIMCHGCAKGNCPAGITTQDDKVAERLMQPKGKGGPALRVLPAADPQTWEEERYADATRGVRNYLLALAEDVRARLAAAGLRSTRELVGRVDLLEQVSRGNPRADLVDLSELLVDLSSGSPSRRAEAHVQILPVSELNAALVREVERAQFTASQVTLSAELVPGDRAVGATLAGLFASGKLHRPPQGVVLRLNGFAGQGLGFALTDGMRLEMDGYANDTVGEGMSGGRIVVRAPPGTPGDRARSLIGNAAAYGATDGTLFAAGRAGQRFGVRNSGATLVCEGAGKYAFEYMTGGLGLVLGPIGSVCGSGFTGGEIWLYDAEGDAATRIHKDAKIAPASPEDLSRLRALVEDFARETQSPRAAPLVAEWDAHAPRFLRLVSAI